MLKLVFFPLIYLCFAALSLTILQSIAPGLVKLQALSFTLGGVILIITSRLRPELLKPLLKLGYALSIVGLIATLLIGGATRGSTRWIELGPVNLQFSQFAVPLTLSISSLLVSQRSLRTLGNQLKFWALIGIPAGLIFIEPDLDTTIVLLLSAGAIFFCRDVPWIHLLRYCAVCVISILIAWFFLLQPYQRGRVFSFLDSSDPQGANYNAQQSLIAVGSGQLTGRGLGHGVQSHLRFLPERQTDFVFASFAEETGFLGASLVLLLYFALISRGFWVYFHVTDRFAQYLSLGLSSLIFIQMSINIAMNIGLFPIAGLTLPLISYGGSSVLAYALVLGLLQQLSLHATTRRLQEVK